MHFSGYDQKYSEFNSGHFGIEIKRLRYLRPSWKFFIFFKLGNGRGQNRVGASKQIE